MTVMSVAVLIPVMPTTVAAVVVAVLVPFALFPALSLHFAFALMILIVTLIFRVVFPRFHEVHRPIASVVFLAVLAPIFCMTRRDVQIDGRRRYELRLDQHGLCVDESRWTLVADTDLTIYAGTTCPDSMTRMSRSPARLIPGPAISNARIVMTRILKILSKRDFSKICPEAPSVDI
jgi:hypothetical protein